MNYFFPATVAARYAKGRPFFHPIVVARIQSFLSLTKPLRHALDVACGTGLSTLALSEIAERVVGIDNAAQMISLAPHGARRAYAVASAELLPFDARTFDLMTVSSAFHWFDRERFMREAARVLCTGGHLIVYDNYFSSRMLEDDAFGTWFRESYLKHYPSPPRNEVNFTLEDASREGFTLRGCESYENTINFTSEELINYLTTQSNVIAAVEGGSETLESVKQSLAQDLLPIFRQHARPTFLFKGPIWFLQRAN